MNSSGSPEKEAIAWIEQRLPGFSAKPECVASAESEMGDEIIRHLVALAFCEANRNGNLAGQELLHRLPRPWLLERIDRLLEPVVAADDPWAWHRLLEFAQGFDDALAGRLAEKASASTEPEVREAADDLKP